jgi:hypothetical protein
MQRWPRSVLSNYWMDAASLRSQQFDANSPGHCAWNGGEEHSPVLDDGPETGTSMVMLDNVDVNGTLIGRQ